LRPVSFQFVSTPTVRGGLMLARRAELYFENPPASRELWQFNLHIPMAHTMAFRRTETTKNACRRATASLHRPRPARASIVATLYPAAIDRAGQNRTPRREIYCGQVHGHMNFEIRCKNATNRRPAIG
jgi:hypothetical protein